MEIGYQIGNSLKQTKLCKIKDQFLYIDEKSFFNDIKSIYGQGLQTLKIRLSAFFFFLHNILIYKYLQ